MADHDPHARTDPGLPLQAGRRALEILDALPHGVMVLAPQRGVGGTIMDLRIEYANEAALAASRAERPELEGHALHAVLPGFPDELYEGYLEVLATGIPLHTRRHLRDTLPSGRSYDAVLDIVALRLRGDVVLFFEDVTAVASQQRAGERYRALLEATPDWVSFFGPEGIAYINPGGRRMIGIAEDEDVVNLDLGAFSPDWVSDLAEREILPALARQGMWRGDTARLHRDGREIPVSQVTVAPVATDGIGDFYATIARDVSGEREAAGALRESEERFRVAFEQAPIGIALTALDGTFLQVNDAYCATVRRRRADLLGLTVTDITHPEDKELTVDSLREIWSGGRPSFQFEKRYVDPDGRPIWVEVSGSPFRDAAGDARFIIGQVRDVGDRRVAHVLQSSMLTTHLPRLDDVEVAVRYLPASADAEVSGDWYDVVELPGGRLGIAVGDVVGRGVEAAGTMSQLRTALRAYAVEGLGPAEVVLRMHRLVDRLGDGLSTTLVLLELDPGTGEMRYVSAGHLPPALLAADGCTRLLADGRSTPLGTAPLGPAVEEGRLVLAPGETVLLYTDGLVERRDDAIDVRLEALRAVLARAPEPLEGMLDHLIAELLGGDPRHDDVALLALRTSEPEQAPLLARIGDGAAGLASARAQLRAWLAVAGAGEDDVTDVLLAAGEACANAVEHAGTGAAVQLRARRSGADVVVTVRDEGTWRPPRARSERGHGLRLMRLLSDSVRVMPTDQGTHVELRRRLDGRRDQVPGPPPAAVTARAGRGTVHVTREHDVPVARLEGEVDPGGVAELRSAVERAVAPGDPGLVLDLGGVAYLDSAGLHLVHDVARVLDRRGQRVRVVAPEHPRIARVLELVALADTVPVDATVAAACAALVPRPDAGR